MWGKVWILPLYTVIVAIFSAPFASGDCECGGPTMSDPSSDSIDVLACGATAQGEAICADAGNMVCVCDYGVSIDVDVIAFLAGIDDEPTITWWCDHNGGDGYCTNCSETSPCTGQDEICCPETGLCSVPDP
ncbi:unnamed protein product, partial [Ectocarpus sp. 13 AM-2016]